MHPPFLVDMRVHMQQAHTLDIEKDIFDDENLLRKPGLQWEDTTGKSIQRQDSNEEQPDEGNHTDGSEPMPCEEINFLLRCVRQRRMINISYGAGVAWQIARLYASSAYKGCRNRASDSLRAKAMIVHVFSRVPKMYAETYCNERTSSCIHLCACVRPDVCFHEYYDEKQLTVPAPSFAIPPGFMALGDSSKELSRFVFETRRILLFTA